MHIPKFLFKTIYFLTIMHTPFKQYIFPQLCISQNFYFKLSIFSQLCISQRFHLKLSIFSQLCISQSFSFKHSIFPQLCIALQLKFPINKGLLYMPTKHFHNNQRCSAWSFCSWSFLTVKVH